MKRRFSVLIPVYNREKLVRQAIDSVLAQTFADREIIVVDDGSTDRTPEVLAAYGERVRVLHQGNRGPEAARNQAAAAACGEYLVFLDSDDVLLPFALSAYDKVATDHGCPPLIVGAMRWFQEDTNPSGQTQFDGISVDTFSDFLAKSTAVSISFSVLVIQRRVFQEVGGVRVGTFPADDYDLMLRVGMCGRCVIIKGPVTVGYRSHEGSGHLNLDRMVRAIFGLVEAQRRGEYPGGGRRWFDRSAYIGGASWLFLKRSWKGDRRDLAAKLLKKCGLMIAVGGARKLLLLGCSRLGLVKRSLLAVPGKSDSSLADHIAGDLSTGDAGGGTHSGGLG